MSKFDTTKTGTGEEGNVLFLILIAVALFAALSYAVTQSSRSGGSDANNETNLVNSAQITQYPASVRTAIIRMIISNSIDETTLEFNPPSNFGGLTSNTYGVFHPSGGGASFVQAPAEVMASGAQAYWFFSADYYIENIGTTANDIIAFLPSITESICERINTELGISGSTDADSDGVWAGPSTLPIYGTHSMDSGNTGIGTAADGVAAFDVDADYSAQPFGCYDQDDASSGGPFVYYHVLLER